MYLREKHDLGIVEDREVIAFLKKGPKYRPPSKINWIDCHDTIDKAVRTYCKSWIKREKVDKKALDNYIRKIMKIVNIRIEHHKENYVDFNKTPQVSKIKVKLQKYGKKYVFVPADKATNNVVVI